jgi:ABC-type transporter Mla subunit MlaD
MPLQDLTPQLRTRLNRMEKAVGWFVFLATALLLFGFGYYIYHTAERKGWFRIKAPFVTFVQSSSGLNVGDDVVMMGFAVGKITGIQAMPPGDKRNVRVDFEIHSDNRADYFRYIWRDGSYVKVNSADFLGKRQLEVTRGTNGPAICVTQPGVWKTIPELAQAIVAQPERWQLYQDILDENSNLIFGAYTMLTSSNLERMAQMNFPSNAIFVYDNKPNFNHIVASWDNRVRRYVNFDPGHETAWLRAVETPPIGDQVQGMVSQVEAVLPSIFAMTNKLNVILDNAALATSNLNTTLVSANNTIVAVQPVVTNLSVITGELRDPGSPLLWALGADGNVQVQGALTNLNTLLVNTDTNLGALLFNLADLTGGLNQQVQANTNLLGGVAKTVGDVDDLVQGLKRHWLLRSAFKAPATNPPPTKTKIR